MHSGSVCQVSVVRRIPVNYVSAWHTCTGLGNRIVSQHGYNIGNSVVYTLSSGEFCSSQVIVEKN